MPHPPGFARSPSPVNGGRPTARKAASSDPPLRSGGGGLPKVVEGAGARASASSFRILFNRDRALHAPVGEIGNRPAVYSGPDGGELHLYRPVRIVFQP